METPAAVQRMIEATNSADREAFVASFTEDAYLEDWGRSFHGHDGVAAWNETDNIGKHAHFQATDTREVADSHYVVTLVVSGGGFNGTSDIAFEVEGDQISSMVISPD